MLCDLHVHSSFSDGSYTPEELVRYAEKLNLGAIALCDHNTVDGLERFMEEGKRRNVITVPGIEISTEYNKTELHILALFLPEEKYSAVSYLMKRTKELKEKSNTLLVQKLRRDGYKIDYERLKEENRGAYINRAHIAQYLTQAGYTASIKEAFDSLLAPGKGYYTEPSRLSTLEIIEFINSIGAVSVWAHPFLNMSEEQIDIFLPIAKEHGLRAIETHYSTYSPDTQKKAEELCKKYSLLQSGGSDFHGTRKPDIEMGKGKGNLQIPFEFYKKLV